MKDLENLRRCAYPIERESRVVGQKLLEYPLCGIRLADQDQTERPVFLVLLPGGINRSRAVEPHIEVLECLAIEPALEEYPMDGLIR